MKISILLPGNTNRATGGYKVIYEYSNKLSSYGHDVCIYYYYGSMFENLHIPNIFRLMLVKFFTEVVGPGLWFNLEKRIKKKVIQSSDDILNADVVIATSIGTAEDVFNLPIQCGKKFYFIQGFENWNRTDQEVYASYKYDMTKIVVAKWLKQIVDKHSYTESILISNCINTSIFYDRGYDRKKHSIVFHYRSDECKGAKYALKVIEILMKKYPDLTVDVISTEKKPYNLPNCCIYHYKIRADEISKINNNSQVFMCSSIEEGFGLPGLEAMACGCALVSTCYKGVLEYAIDSVNALLSPVKDVHSMAANIERLFEDETLRKNISNNGVKTGIERSLDKSAKMFESVLIK